MVHAASRIGRGCVVASVVALAIALRAANKTTAQPPGGRGRCSESSCTTRTLRFLCAVHAHLATARYVLVAALNCIEVDVATFPAHHGCLGNEDLITSTTKRVDVFQLS